MKSFTTQTILATLAYSVLTVNGLNVQRGIMSAIQQDVAKLGDTCEGFNESTGRPYPSCAFGLACVDSGKMTITGAHKHCTMNRPMPLASEGETCGGHNEETGRPFTSCADGLVCQSINGVGIPGTLNVCMKPLAGKGETC